MVDIEASHAEHGRGTMVRDNSWSRASQPIQGDLSNILVSQLLQSFLPAKATGMLEIRAGEGNSMIWYEDGILTHAVTGDLVGDDAVMSVVGWKSGQFKFEPRVKTDAKSVRSIIESLVIQGTQLAERKAYLRSAGIDINAVLIPVNPRLSELEFIHKVNRNPPMDMATLGRFYQALDGRKSLSEVYQFMGLTPGQIFVLVYHLLICDCIKVARVQPERRDKISETSHGQQGSTQLSATSSRPNNNYASTEVAKNTSENNQSQSNGPLKIEPRSIDSGAIQSVMMNLRRAETGMFIYPAFLYFLEQEYFRSYRAGSPLAVLVFEMRYLTKVGNDLVRQLLPPAALLDAVGRISTLKRHIDLLAHYDAFDYAMLLPNTKSSGAQVFANRLVKSLTASPLAGSIDASKLLLSFGAASVPEDSLDLSLLLGAADTAMNIARQNKQPLVMFRDIKGVAAGSRAKKS
jgi:GGDEF domain-containing protein